MFFFLIQNSQLYVSAFMLGNMKINFLVVFLFNKLKVFFEIQHFYFFSG